MNEIKLFENEEFGSVRTVMVGDKPYFVAKDVAMALGYIKCLNAISRHCKNATTQTVITSGGAQEVKVIPEGDVYRLIINSKLPSAEKFESWVMDEVLPQIRKTGGYIPVNEIDDETTILAKAYEIMQKTLYHKDEIIANQKKYIDDNAGNIAFAEAVTNDDDTCIDFAQMAKILQNKGLFDGGRNKLMEDLRGWKVLMANNTPYQAYMSKFKVIITEKNGREYVKTLINTKGQAMIVNGYAKIKNNTCNQ